MKKILLLALLGVTLISCSKEELELNDQQILEMDLHLDNCATLAGPDNSIDLTIKQIEEKYNSVSRLQSLYNSLLGEGVSSKGKWTPTIEELAMRYVNSTEKYGAYTSTFTITNGDCTDYADITVNVVSECHVYAGPDNTSTVLTISEVDANYNSISKLKILYRSLIGDGVPTTGTFSPTIEAIGMAYVNAEDKTGYYSTTYSYGTGNCVDTAELGVTVVEDQATDPVCTVDAGPDNSVTLTINQIEKNYYSVSRLESLYNSLLETSVRGTGIWSPSITELAMQYKNASDKTGPYTSSYIVTNGDCTDSADITVVVTNN